ncbi:MAG: ABC transporter ATP-binding protein, partial [Peptococcaceae bacterium]|nr:ABC transporter ATP-binding protein [Peptococcaceae bacterium]
MLKHLLSCLGHYWKYALLAPSIILIEVCMEILMPLVMAKIIDVGIANGDVGYVTRMGLLMIGMAILSLCAGALAGRFAAIAGAGFAKGIRQKLFYKVQEFSFRNIDHFTTASLITRLTTDVNNAQMAFMMLIRTAVRSPMMLLCATFMAFYINSKLAKIFLIAIPVLAIALYIIATKTYPRFQEMLTRYDKLNARVQENLTAIHLVKAFVRED